MPTNKNAQLRYRILDRCFSNFHRKYAIEDLLNEVNEALIDLYGPQAKISIRQIREDLKYMRDSMGFDAPIVAFRFGEGNRCFYRYDDKDFTIFNNELTDKELHDLCSIIEMLQKYRGMPSSNWLEPVISNLEYRFGIKPRRENLISFEQNEQLRGLEHLSTIIDATANHQPLSIKYVSYKGKHIVATIHPYYVKQYNSRWFLFGLNEEYGDISNMALDRIESVMANHVVFQPNRTIDFNAYFEDVVGVTLPKHHVVKEDVVLRFAVERYPYIASKPLHHSQRPLAGTTDTVVLSVRPNLELQALILSFGPDVEVVSPAWLRDEISRKIEDTSKNYKSMQKDCTDGG